VTLSAYGHSLTAAQVQTIRRKAEKAFPDEACGFVLTDGRAIACPNVALDKGTFEMRPEDSAAYLDQAVAIWHSHLWHPGFSRQDVDACHTLQVPYAVWDCGSSELFWLDPRPSAGLIGRPWNYGVHDCFAAMRDWYYQERELLLADEFRGDEYEWANSGFHQFKRIFDVHGFKELPEGVTPVRGDLVLMQLSGHDYIDHVAVIEDPSKNLILHHLCGRQSALDDYGRLFRTHTYALARRQ